MAVSDPLDQLPPVARAKARGMLQDLPQGWRLGNIVEIAQPTATTFLLRFVDARGIIVAVHTIYCSAEDLG